MFKLFFQSRRNIFVSALLVAIFVLAGILFFLQYQKLKCASVPLAENNLIGRFVVAQSQDQSERDLSIFRLNDGKEEKMPGSWNFSFLSPGEIALFGHFKEEQDKQRFFTVTEKGGVPKDISSLPGQIINISQNLGGTYFLIEGIKNISATEVREETKEKQARETYFCVSEKFIPKIEPCRQIFGDILKEYDTEKNYKVFWNQNKQRELIIEESSDNGKIYAFDPWEQSPMETTREKISEPGEGEQALSAMRNSLDRKWMSKHYEIKRWAYLTKIFDRSTDKDYYFWLPPKNQIVWVSSQHIITTNGNTAFLIDIFSRKKSELFKLPGAKDKIFSFY